MNSIFLVNLNYQETIFLGPEVKADHHSLGDGDSKKEEYCHQG
jgi:hypothetical protein